MTEGGPVRGAGPFGGWARSVLISELSACPMLATPSNESAADRVESNDCSATM